MSIGANLGANIGKGWSFRKRKSYAASTTTPTPDIHKPLPPPPYEADPFLSEWIPEDVFGPIKRPLSVHVPRSSAPAAEPQTALRPVDPETAFNGLAMESLEKPQDKEAHKVGSARRRMSISSVRLWRRSRTASIVTDSVVVDCGIPRM
jgi:hypothetical protein